MKEHKWDLFALASIPLIMTLGNSMLLPVLPQIARQLSVSSFQVSMIITVYSIVAILMIPVAGYASDRLGRKKVLLPSLLTAAAGGAVSVAAAWMAEGAGAYWIILGGRFLQGIGAAGAFPIVLPFVGDMFQDEKEVSKSLGLIETSNTFGKVLSPILGAFLGSILWFAPFIAIPVLCVISFVLVLLLVKEPEAAGTGKAAGGFRDFARGIKRLLVEKGRWLYAIFAIGGVCMFILFGVLFYLSETLENQYNLHGSMKGLVLAIPLTLLCLSSFGGGKVIGQNKVRMKWLGCSGMILVSAMMIMSGFTTAILWLVIYQSIGGIGIGITLPCMDALITEGIAKENRGTITSLYSSMRFIGVALGPPVVSLLMVRGHWLLFGIMAAVGAAAGLLALFSITPDKSRNGDGEGSGKPQREREGGRKGNRQFAR
ncbi:MAG: transporter [Paenibacillaceae bacterium]|jgi:ACDE family multidrug resistance protein|nr:transporter [Paenibacillaceae bacterium]